ncbi:MAG: hypothetical protein HY787_01080 [Deltaproteobacteria bacterium]|nr:hypothetical protein [Deltaproteobacteria bacterium]
MPGQKEMLDQLKRGKVFLPPLSFRFLKSQPNVAGSLFDALIEVSWDKNRVKFAVECKSLSTPKAFQEGVNALKLSALPKDYRPILLLPFLNNQQLEILEREGISGIDLCGNGIVIVPGIFSVFRSGQKNCFPSSALIKNIYRKNSSMVGRVFFSRPCYGSVNEIWSEVNRRNILVAYWNKDPMGLSTVSKSLKGLEDDLIIERKENICLLQADKLLEKLSENYAPPKIRKRVQLKISEGGEAVREVLKRLSKPLGLPLVAAGTSSVGQYAVMPRGEVLSVYCPSLERLLNRLPGNPSDRFPDLELIETDDETVYFDAREQDGFWWASPVQVYLELMTGDRRDRETAEQIKSFLISPQQPSKSS